MYTLFKPDFINIVAFGRLGISLNPEMISVPVYKILPMIRAMYNVYTMFANCVYTVNSVHTLHKMYSLHLLYIVSVHK